MKEFNNEKFGTQHAKAAINWLISMKSAEEWDLSLSEQAKLLGGVSERQLLKWIADSNADRNIYLNSEIMERLSVLLSIYKQLKEIAPVGRVDDTVKSFCKPNPNKLFDNLSLKDFILKDGRLESMFTVRTYLKPSICS